MPRENQPERPQSPLGGDGLRGPDKHQPDLRDQDSMIHQRSASEVTDEQRSPTQTRQPGAEVRAEPVKRQDPGPEPEGLHRPRTHPVDKSRGRDEQAPAHTPSNTRGES